MPFDKQIPVSGEGTGSRFLLLTALAVAASLLFGGLGMRLFPADTGEAMMGELLENEAVTAFLGLSDGE